MSEEGNGLPGIGVRIVVSQHVDAETPTSVPSKSNGSAVKLSPHTLFFLSFFLLSLSLSFICASNSCCKEGGTFIRENM